MSQVAPQESKEIGNLTNNKCGVVVVLGQILPLMVDDKGKSFLDTQTSFLSLILALKRWLLRPKPPKYLRQFLPDQQLGLLLPQTSSAYS